MDSETRDILDGAAELGPDGYEVAANAELGELVTQNVARTGVPLDSDAVAFDSLLNIDYDDCSIGACAPSTRMPPPPGKRPEMTFWDAHGLIAKAAAHGVALNVTARTCTLIDRALKTAQKHSLRTQHVMLASYHYETLPGRIGGTEVVIVDDVLDTNARPVNVGWRFVAPTSTNLDAVKASGITAADLSNPNLPLEWDNLGNVTIPEEALRQAAVDARLEKAAGTRHAAHSAWRDSFETDQAWMPGDATTFTADAVIGLLREATPVDDAAALRALANRIAYSSGSPKTVGEAKAALVHLARVAGAMAAAAADVALVQVQVTDAEDKTIDEIGQVVRDLVAASATLEHFARKTF